jgi:hypothetical protein
MITRVHLRYFKRFEEETFDLSDHVILAGPNNSGKTTLLQAIVAWNLALQRWKEKRGPESGSMATQRTGIPLARKDFTALPLREMDLLWTDCQTALKKKDLKGEAQAGQPRVLTITLGGKRQNEDWSLGFEFRRQSTELVYVKPIPEHLDYLPSAAEDVRVVHVPPFSGIGSEETRYDRPYQDLLVGQGKAGDILRNLLYEVFNQGNKGPWTELRDQIEQIFGYRLLEPQYEGMPYILCEYRGGVPKGKGRDGLPQLDIASAGSGFHQVLLLLGFFYARPSTVLLLDEPDAHLHIILKKQIYDMLRRIASERRCQLIIATHADALIDATSPEQILSFYQRPHGLISDIDREQVREALKHLTATDILLAERAGGVLYLEDDADFELLKAWANVLKHPVATWFNERPFWHNNHGRNPAEAKGHFFALRAIRRDIHGVLILDGDNRDLPDHDVRADGLEVLRWQRYEVESYLIHPQVLRRYVEKFGGHLFADRADTFLRDQLPPAVYRDPLAHHEYLRTTPASKTLLPGFFESAQLPITKSEYYLVAETMTPDELPEEVKEKLTALARTIGVE